MPLDRTYEPTLTVSHRLTNEPAVKVCVGGTDIDQLRFLGVALARFGQMTAEELRAYLRG
jgi:hypothetical protein